jgi:hypothetical protein
MRKNNPKTQAGLQIKYPLTPGEWDFRGIPRGEIRCALIYEHIRSDAKLVSRIGKWLDTQVLESSLHPTVFTARRAALTNQYFRACIAAFNAVDWDDYKRIHKGSMFTHSSQLFLGLPERWLDLKETFRAWLLRPPIEEPSIREIPPNTEWEAIRAEMSDRSEAQRLYLSMSDNPDRFKEWTSHVYPSNPRRLKDGSKGFYCFSIDWSRADTQIVKQLKVWLKDARKELRALLATVPKANSPGRKKYESAQLSQLAAFRLRNAGVTWHEATRLVEKICPNPTDSDRNRLPIYASPGAFKNAADLAQALNTQIKSEYIRAPYC